MPRKAEVYGVSLYLYRPNGQPYTYRTVNVKDRGAANRFARQYIALLRRKGYQVVSEQKDDDAHTWFLAKTEDGKEQRAMVDIVAIPF